jgi:hypothetical protein
MQSTQGITFSGTRSELIGCGCGDYVNGMPAFAGMTVDTDGGIHPVS